MTEAITITFAGAQCTGKSRLMKEIKEKCQQNFDINDSIVEHVLTARMKNNSSPKLRVWHIPQVPGKPFYVEAESIQEAVKLMNTLAAYDSFQLENNIKGDYANMNGLEFYDETISDQELVEMGLEDRWMTWYIETEDNFFEDPKEYLEYLTKQA